MSVVGSPSRPLQYFKAIANADLPTGTKATCWAIASFADNDTGRAYPSLKVLAAASGLTPAVLSKHTARAEEAGYLRKERRHNSSIVYTITIPAAAFLPPQATATRAPESYRRPWQSWAPIAHGGEPPF